jgi:hypothetical protein
VEPYATLVVCGSCLGVERVSNADRRAARELAGVATTQVGGIPVEEAARSRPGRLMRAWRTTWRSWPSEEKLTAPWRDTASANRPGWRERAAYLGDEEVFAVDYQICRTCGLGWVEEPYTNPSYQRCGLAAAGLAAIRSQNQGLEWHTLGGHFRDSEPFWLSLVQELVASIPNGISVPTGPLTNGVTAFLELALAALVFCVISDLNGGGHESGLSSLEAAYGGPRLAGSAGAGCSLAG